MTNGYQRAGAEEQTYRIFMNPFGKVKVTISISPMVMMMITITEGCVVHKCVKTLCVPFALLGESLGKLQ